MAALWWLYDAGVLLFEGLPAAAETAEVLGASRGAVTGLQAAGYAGTGAVVLGGTYALTTLESPQDQHIAEFLRQHSKTEVEDFSDLGSASEAAKRNILNAIKGGDPDFETPKRAKSNDPLRHAPPNLTVAKARRGNYNTSSGAYIRWPGSTLRSLKRARGTSVSVGIRKRRSVRIR